MPAPVQRPAAAAVAQQQPRPTVTHSDSQQNASSFSSSSPSRQRARSMSPQHKLLLTVMLALVAAALAIAMAALLPASPAASSSASSLASRGSATATTGSNVDAAAAAASMRDDSADDEDDDEEDDEDDLVDPACILPDEPAVNVWPDGRLCWLPYRDPILLPKGALDIPCLRTIESAQEVLTQLKAECAEAESPSRILAALANRISEMAKNAMAKVFPFKVLRVQAQGGRELLQVSSCSGHGVMGSNSMCQCDDGYLKQDCSLRYDFQQSLTSMQDGGVLDLKWTYDSTKLYVQLRAETRGYVALMNQADDGAMFNGDAWVGWIAPDGVSVILSDRFATTQNNPSYDSSQDLTEGSGWKKQISGVWTTQISFSRLQTTADSAKDRPIVPGGGDTLIGYAFKDTTTMTSTPSQQLLYHDSRQGNLYVNFFQTKGPPSQPDSPTFVSATGNSLTLSWTAPATIGSGGTLSDYKVQYQLASGGGTTWTVGYTGPDTTATITGLAGGTAYSVQVAASNTLDGFGAFSAATSMTTQAGASPPDAPAAPTFTSATATTLTFSFVAPATHGDAITGYTLQSSTTSAMTGFTNTGTAAAGATSGTISGLTAGTQYYVRIVANTASAGSSQPSAATSMSTSAASAPDAPTAPTYTSATSTSLTFSFIAPTTNGAAITGYILQSSTTSATAGFSNTGTAAAGATSGTISGLTANTQHWVRIIATSSAGNSPNSPATSMSTTAANSPPNAPAAPSFISATSTSLTLNWTAPTTNGAAVTGYQIQKSTTSASAGFTTAANAGASTFSGTISSLTAGTQYWIRIVATSSVGNSPPSSASSMSTLATASAPNAPAAPTFTSATSTSLTLSWTAPSTNGAAVTGYQIQTSTTSATGGFTLAATAAAGTLSGTISGLTASTQYYVRIIATSSAGNSPNSPATSMSTTAAAAVCSGHGAQNGAVCQCDAGWLTSTCGLQADFSWCNSDSSWCMFWTYDASNVFVQLRATALGWVGMNIGSATTGGMDFADMWQFGVAASGSAWTTTANDAFSTGANIMSISPDSIQNLQDASGYQTATQTFVYFRRALNTGDGSQDKVISSGTSRASWAWATSDSFTRAHSDRDLFTINWLATKGAPAVPAAPTKTSATQTSLVVAWTAPAYNGSGTFLGYNLQYSVGSGAYTTAYTGEALTYTITGLTAGTAYNVRVASSNSMGGMSAYSSVAALSTNAAGQLPPNAPAAPTFTSATTSSLTFSWTAPATNGATLTGYSLQISTASATTGFVDATPATAGAAATSATLTGLVADTQYWVRLAATSSNGNSAYSAAASMRTSPFGACPNACSGHGICVAAQCQCDRGFVKSDCSMAATGFHCSASSTSSATSGICLRWANDDTKIYVQAESYAGLTVWAGWILGPDSTGGMNNGDAIVLLPNAGISASTVGTAAVLQDAWSSSIVTPPYDAIQSFTDIVTFVRPAAAGAPTSVVGQFSRLLNTGDSFDKVLTASPMRMSWAIGPGSAGFREHVHSASTQGLVAAVTFVSAFVAGPPSAPLWPQPPVCTPVTMAASSTSVTVQMLPSLTAGSSAISGYQLFVFAASNYAYLNGGFSSLDASQQASWVAANSQKTVFVTPAGVSNPVVVNQLTAGCYALLTQASNAQGAGPFSTAVQVCTLRTGDVAPSAPDATRILLDGAAADTSAAPAVSSQTNSAALSWPTIHAMVSVASPAFLGYNLQYQLSTAGTWMDVTSCGGVAAQAGRPLTSCGACDVTGLQASSAYNFRLQVVNVVGAGMWSEPLAVQTAGFAACPNECSGQGECVEGQCVCTSPFLSDDCSVKGNVKVFSESPRIVLTHAVVDHNATTAGARRRLLALEPPTFYGELSVDYSPDKWIGFIFGSTADGMSGGDSWGIAWPTSGGVVMDDRMADGLANPASDPQQDLTNIKGHPALPVAGETYRVTFQRLLNTGDARDLVIAPGLVMVSWAVGTLSGVVVAGSPIPMAEHDHSSAASGKSQLDLYSGESVAVPEISLDMFLPMPVLIGLFCVLAVSFRSCGPIRRTRVVQTVLHQPLLRSIRRFCCCCFSSGCAGEAPKSGYRQTWFDTLTLDLRRTVTEISIGESILLCFYLIAIATIAAVGKSRFEEGGRAVYMLWGDMTALHLALALLPVARTSIFLATCGISFERAVKWHRWVARVATGLMVAHFITMLGHYPLSKLLEIPAVATTKGAGNVYGAAAGVCMILMTLFAFEPIRRNLFRAFYYMHLVLLIPVYTLACLHSSTCFALCIIPLGLYILDRALRAWRGLRTTTIVGMEVIDVDVPDAASSGGQAASPPKPSTCLVHLQLHQDGFTFTPGQYVFLNIPQLSYVAWHPFSISSACDGESGNFSLHILAKCGGVAQLREACRHFSGGAGGVRSAPGIVTVGTVLSSANAKMAVGGGAQSSGWGQSGLGEWEGHVLDHSTWTGELLAQAVRFLARVSSGGALLPTDGPVSPFSARVDGPYGKINMDMLDYRTIILVAGGIGITPFFSILSNLLSAVDSASCTIDRVHLVWVCSDAGIFSLVHPDLWARLQSHARFQLHFYSTKSQKTDRAQQAHEQGPGSLPVMHGRPDWRDLFPAMLARSAGGGGYAVHDSSPQSAWQANPVSGRNQFDGVSVEMSAVVDGNLQRSDASSSDISMHAHDAAIFACGPAPLVNDVEEHAQWHECVFHKEVFAL